MIGYYVHHQGSGHLHRAGALARALETPVTALSSLPRPSWWDAEWVQLESDQDGDGPEQVTAGGQLHWAPRGDPGLMSRMTRISGWLAAARPDALVCDVSVEVALLARLHGVPVVSVVLPGDRGDRPHRTGYAISETLVAFWPAEADGLVEGLGAADRRRLHCLGGLSRYPVQDARAPRSRSRRRVVVLSGSGGGGPSDQELDRARLQTPDWDWQVLGGPGAWHEDPYPVVCDADVVITHAGQNAIAEVASARRPAVVIPQERSHLEQRATARALSGGSWPVLVEQGFPRGDWPSRLRAAAALDGAGWRDWCDGGAAERFANLLHNPDSPDGPNRGTPR